MKTWWLALDERARRGLWIGTGCIALLMAAAAWWVLRADRAVLFSDLRPQDAAVMTAELDKLKVPYAIEDNGATLLVDRAQVHAVRLKLMGRELPLHGTVGFELFNNADFGMTEFAQKINFQRALQGELTRTILSFPEVRDVRVHLALPEQGLFQQKTSQPKAAITLALRPGQSLRAEQVRGIQRLVAAAVPGLAAQDVTIVDQQGVALTGSSESEAGGAAAGSLRLELKRETENYLSRKAGAVLEKFFGPGQALATVDVTLNMDQVRVTTEDVLPAVDAKAGPVAGVLVRERDSARDSAAPDARASDGRLSRGSSMQHDSEYQVGRRVEQVVSQPGAIRRLQVVALVRHALSDAQRAQLQQVVSASVGAVPERGDTVVVQALEGSPAAQPAPFSVVPPPKSTGDASALVGTWIAAAAALLACALAFAFRRTVRTRSARALTEGERQLALERVQAWMHDGDASATLQVAQEPKA